MKSLVDDERAAKLQIYAKTDPGLADLLADRTAMKREIQRLRMALDLLRSPNLPEHHTYHDLGSLLDVVRRVATAALTPPDAKPTPTDAEEAT